MHLGRNYCRNYRTQLAINFAVPRLPNSQWAFRENSSSLPLTLTHDLRAKIGPAHPIPGMEQIPFRSVSGLGKTGEGGSEEPSLQWILDTQLGQGLIECRDTDPATNVINRALPEQSLQ